MNRETAGCAVYYFIEPMVEEDISDVQQIERESYQLSWSATTYRRELRSSATSRYIVARASPVLPPPGQSPVHGPPGERRNGLFTGLLPGLFGANRNSSRSFPLVGYAGLWLAVDEAHITTIAVSPRYRGQGVGELLLGGLIDQALHLHAAMLTLEVRVSNSVAQNLYLKYGFRPTGRRPRYYTDNGEDALIMWTEPIQHAEYQARLLELRQQLFARLRLQAEQNASSTPLDQTRPNPLASS